MGIASKKVLPASKVLYTTNALRSAIRGVLEEPQRGDRRVALVAYVGGAAQDFLPDPQGLKLVCCLQPGATDALTLGRLKVRGAELFKSKKLHMKVYWSSRKGCVICSANASGNALGGGGLIEAGVWLPPGAVDVDKLWNAAKPVPVDRNDLKDLATKTPARKPPGSHGSVAMVPSFREWIETDRLRTWKLGWWDATGGGWSKVAEEKARTSYGITKPEDFLLFAEGQANAGEWFLAFDVREPTEAKWFLADFVINVPQEDESAYNADWPYQAVMLRPLKNYEPPPFKLDQSFRNAFGFAVREFGENKFQNLKDLTPTRRFINLIKDALPA